jgi:hypothetical protein
MKVSLLKIDSCGRCRENGCDAEGKEVREATPAEIYTPSRLL